MNGQPISQRSEGPTPDSLGLKVTGDTSLDLDLRRTQEVEVTFRGVVSSHIFEDKRDKHGNVEHTVKWAKVKVDELVEIQVLSIPRRMPGQTAMDVDADEQGGEEREEIVDAEVVAELPAGEPPAGVDPETGEVTDEPERLSPDRHPQVPEDAWQQLNIEQRYTVVAKVERLERLAEYLAGGVTPTDRQVAGDEQTALHNELEREFGIVLIPLEEIPAEEAPAGEPPPPVLAGSGPMTRQQLEERRRYISSRTGLPQPLAEARDEELAEIDRRLKGLGDAA